MVQKRIGGRIANELLMMLRARKKIAREVSIDEKIGVDQEGRELRLMDILESEPVDVLEQLEMQKNIRRMYQGLEQALGERELQVIIWRYGLYGRKELTQREIAGKLGISRSYVSRIEKSALKKLRCCMEEDEKV